MKSRAKKLLSSKLGRRSRSGRKFGHETLEDRRMLATNVVLGTLSQISDTSQISTLDNPADVRYAVNLTPTDGNRTVRGVTFLEDRQAIAGYSAFTQNSINNWKTVPTVGGPDNGEFNAIMHDIRWAPAPNAGTAQFDVTPGTYYRIQVFFDGNDADGGGENRKWDVSFEGQLALDEVRSSGDTSTPEGNASLQNTVSVWTHDFFGPTDGTANIVWGGDNFPGTPNEGGDRNAIWQAIVVAEIPPPPPPAADFRWDGDSDGDGDGVSWDDPLNWHVDSGIPGPTDSVLFWTDDFGQVDLGGVTRQAGLIEFANPAGDFDLTNGTLLTNQISQSAGGANVISAEIDASSGTVVIDVADGSLGIESLSNQFGADDTITVTGGELIGLGDSAGSSLDGADVTLDGGTLTLNGDAAPPPAPNPADPNLELWLDASDVNGDGNPASGEPVNGGVVGTWFDKSSNSFNADNVVGDPNYVASSTANGRPALAFDGDDLLYLSTDLRTTLGDNYSIFTVARYTGGDNERVISSFDHNWLFAFWGNSDERWYADGWIHQGRTPATVEWHQHSGIMEGLADPQADLYRDGTLLVNNGTGSTNNNNHKPSRLSLGGWDATRELSQTEIAEVIIYDALLSDAERLDVEAYLNVKYGINGGSGIPVPADFSGASVTVLSNSTINVGAGASEATLGDITIDNGSTVSITGSGQNLDVAGAVNLSSDGTIEASTATPNFTGGVNLGANTLTFAGTGDINVSTNPIAGIGDVVAAGPGTVTLQSANTYSGTTTVSGGVLIAQDDNALGDATSGTEVIAAELRLEGGISLAAGEVLTLGGTLGSDGDNTAGAPISLSADSSIVSISGTLALPNDVDLANASLTFDGAGDIVVAGDISGNGVFSPTPSLIGLNSFDTGDYSITADGQTFDARIDNDGSASWLLVGRGREGWEFDADGQGAIADVNQNLGTPQAFAPAAYSDAIINDLITSAGLDLTDIEIRLKRAQDPAGNAYQESRWRPLSQASWIWDFDVANTGYATEYEVISGQFAGFSQANTNTRDNNVNNSFERVFTWPWGGHANQQGFSFGSSVNNGANNATSYLWESGTENHAIPYTEVYIRYENEATNNLIKNGTGTVTLAGDNSYSGLTTVNGGNLVADGSATALGVPERGTVVAEGATLTVSGGIVIAGELLTVGGTGAAGTWGALQGAAGANEFNGPVTVTGLEVGFGTVAVGDSLSVASDLNLGVADLISNGPGDVTLLGDISEGTLPTNSLASIDSLATGVHTFEIGGQSFDVYVDNDGTDSWLLVGRGRNGWEFDADGQGNPADVIVDLGTPAAFAPAAYSSDIVNEFLAQVGGDMSLVDVRIERSEDTTGSTYQETRWTNWPTTDWTWVFDPGINITRQIVEGTGAGAAGPGNTRDSGNNNLERIFTWAWSGHGNQRGFSYGNVDTAGTNDGTNFLWENGTENHALPYSEVYIRVAGTLTRNEIIQAGSGSLTLAGDNSHNSETIVAAGTLVAASDTALGTSSSGTTVHDGTTLAFEGGVTIAAEDIAVLGAATVLNRSGDNTVQSNITSAPDPIVSSAITTFTGGDVGEGLDFDGDIIYAVNAAGPAAGAIRDANFTDEAGEPNVTITANQIANPWAAPNYGSTANDDALELVMTPIRWSSGTTVDIDVTNLTPGNRYQLQLLFLEACCDRGFDVSIDGVLVADEFSPVTYQRGNNLDGAVLTHVFDAVDSDLFVQLNGLTAGFPDKNAILQGLTVENIGVVSGLTIESTTGTLNVDGNIDALNTLTATGDGATVVNGTIFESNPTNLVKEGTGSLTLAAANAYTGGTTISGGNLVAANTSGSATGSGGIVIDGDFARLAGTGSVSGSVDANMQTTSSIIDVGDDLGLTAPVASTLDVGSTTVAGGILMFDITDNDATDDVVDVTLNDRLNVTGTVDLIAQGWLSLHLADNVRPANGVEIVLVQNDGTDAIVVDNTPGFAPLFDFATNDPLPEGAMFTVAVDDGGVTRNRQFTISYVGGDGNDLTVTHINNAPVPVDDAVAGPEDVPLTAPFMAGDPDNDLVVSATITTPPANGAVVSNGDGTFTYTPDAHFSGTDTFSYTANDGELDSATQATITITIDPIADAPNLDVGSGTVNGDEDTAIPLGVTSSLVDADGSEVLEIVITGVPTGATLSAGTDNGGGQWTLTPAELTGVTVTPVLNSDVDFTLTITATATESDPAPTPADQSAATTETLTVTVNPIADAPAVSTVPVGGPDNENIPIDLGLGGALFDTDGSETITSVVITGVPADATLSAGIDNGGGMWTLTEAELTGLTMTKLDGGHNPSTVVTLTVTFEVTDVDTEGLVPDDMGTLSSDLDVTVDNTPPTSTIAVQGGATQTVSGFATPFVVTAADINPGDTPFSYTINWGDGSPVETFPGLTDLETIEHAFTNFGTLTVTVQAADADGELGPASTTTIEVVPVAVIDGDIYAGGTNNSDTIIYYPSNAGVTVRFNTSFFGPFQVQAGTQLLAFGQGGNDRIIVAGPIGAPAVFDGGIGNDYLGGYDLDDTLIGGAGNDIVLGGEGNNLLIGDDREGLVPQGSDRLEGRDGVDYIFGGGGNDRANGGAGDDVIDGGLGNDYLFGGLGDDFLVGGGGSDLVNGHYGNDVLFGGGDSDQIFGSNDHDLIVAGAGRDRVRGDAGDDDIVGGTSALDAQIEAALAAILAGTEFTPGVPANSLLTAGSDGAAVDSALELWFAGSDRGGFGGFIDDGLSEDLAGSSGSDEVHGSDGLRDFRVGEDSTF